MAEFLGVVELGTLYGDGVEYPLPTRPWSSANYPSNLSERGNGNIPLATSLKDIGKWVIGNTSSNPKNKLKWIKIKDENKILLICDRVILNDITWQELNNLGCVFGTEIIIDGIKCKCRLLTGGSDFRYESNNYKGGDPINNEWDRFIVNEDNIEGLIRPSLDDLDDKLDYNDLDGDHNQLWHWWGSTSICQETYTKYSSMCTQRGWSSANFLNYVLSNKPYRYIGWRPVLEILEYKRYLLKQENKYYSIAPKFYINGTYQSLILEGDTPNNSDYENFGFSHINNLCTRITVGKETFRPIDVLKKINNGRFNIVMKQIL